MDFDKDGIVELAGVSSDHDELYQSFCNPQVPINVEARAVHHIDDKMIETAPRPAAAFSEMLKELSFEESFVLVAHNAQFDREFIGRLSDVFKDPNLWVCTYRCALHLYPEAPAHSNQVLRYWLNVDVELPSDLYPHRALYDALVTEAILIRMLQTHSLDDLIALSSKPVVLRKVRFGKHKGMLWKDVPTDYLKWLLRQSDIDSDVRHTAYTLSQR